MADKKKSPWQSFWETGREPLPGFGWKFPSIEPQYKAWKSQVGSWMQPKAQPRAVRQPTTSAVTPWPKEAMYPEGATIGPIASEAPWGRETFMWQLENLARDLNLPDYVIMQAANYTPEQLKATVKYYADQLRQKTAGQEKRGAWTRQEIEAQYPKDWRERQWTPGFITPKETVEARELPGWYGAMAGAGAGLGGVQFTPEASANEAQRQRTLMYQRGQQAELEAVYPEEFKKIRAKPEYQSAAMWAGSGAGALGAEPPDLYLANLMEQQPEYKTLQTQYNQSLRYGIGLFGKPAYPQALWTEYDRYASEEEFPMTFTQWFSNTPEAQSFMNWYQKTEREEKEVATRQAEMQTRQPRMTPWRAR